MLESEEAQGGGAVKYTFLYYTRLYKSKAAGK